MPFDVLVVGAALTYLAPFERRRLAWAVPLHVFACAIAITAAAQIEDNRLARLREPGPVAAMGRGPQLRTMQPPSAGDPMLMPRDGRPPGTRSLRVAHGGTGRPFFVVLASSRWQLHFAAYWVRVK